MTVQAAWVHAASLAIATGASCGIASAQLTPERTYYGINRAIPMRIALPDAESGPTAARADVSIALFDPLSQNPGEPVEIAAAAEGDVDLSTMFPRLWTGASPRVLYAQLIVGDTRIGSSVVLQPLVTPAYAPRLDRDRTPVFLEQKPEERVYSGIRAYADMHVRLDTDKGSIEIKLVPEHAPNTAWSFRSLVEEGYYTDIRVHRVASLTGTDTPDIIQMGDPVGNGTGGPGFMIDLEPSKLSHDYGVVSMARGPDPNSGGSQFFICLSRAAFLDGKYAAFGRVVRAPGDLPSPAVEGEPPVAPPSTLTILGATPVNADNRPLTPPVLRSATLVPAPAYGEGPPPLTDPTLTPVR